jgi:hypothetical protein
MVVIVTRSRSGGVEEGKDAQSHVLVLFPTISVHSRPRHQFWPGMLGMEIKFNELIDESKAHYERWHLCFCFHFASTASPHTRSVNMATGEWTPSSWKSKPFAQVSPIIAHA